MTTKEITKEVLKRNNLKIRGATPQATACARIIEEIKENRDNAIFTKTPTGFILNKKNLKSWRSKFLFDF